MKKSNIVLSIVILLLPIFSYGQNLCRMNFEILFGEGKSQEIRQILSRSDRGPSELLDFLKNYPSIKKLLSGKTATSEGFTVEEHSVRVYETFGKQKKFYPLKNLSEKLGTDLEELMYIGILLHDIGKPVALAAKQKKQHIEYSVELATTILRNLGFSFKEVLLIQKLIGQDFMGEMLKGKKGRTPEIVAEKMAELAKTFALNPGEWVQLQTLFLVSDMSSYRFAGKSLVEVEGGKLVPVSEKFLQLNIWLNESN